MRPHLALVIESTFGGQASSQQASSFDRIQGGDRRVSIEETGTPIRSHPYMHVRPEDRAASLNEAIDRFGERVAPLLGISFGDFAHPAIKSALPNMTVVGRIVVDSTTATHAQRHGKGRPPSAGEGDGGGASLEERAQWEPLRLTPDNILLETSRQIGSGVRVPLEVSQASVALFPGQLVVLEGCNTSGKMFQVSSQKNVLSHCHPLPPCTVASIPAYTAANRPRQTLHSLRYRGRIGMLHQRMVALPSGGARRSRQRGS